MSVETSTEAARKTVNDIWIEVQREQETFNQIIKWLVGLLIVAALIAAAAAVLSYFEFRGMRAAYDEAISSARSQAVVDRGEAARERQSIKIAQLDFRENEEFARREADLVRQVNRAADDENADALIERALQAARNHAVGIRMNEATEHLVATVLDESRAGRASLSGPEQVFLQAIKTDWTSPDGTAEPVLKTIAGDPKSAFRGYAQSALAQLYYDNANNDDLAGDDKCNLSIAAANEAVSLGVDAMGPYLWKGECMRKKGQSAEGYRAFRAAIEWLEAHPEEEATLPTDLVRRAHHGYGTTLVALGAADDVSEVEQDMSVEQAMTLAEERLNIAADMREARGEGAIGRVYTAENIGFIHLQRKDWPRALAHTEYVDEQLPLAWNLTVRHIAAKTVYYQARANSDDAVLSASDAREIACSAQRTLNAMNYNRFDEEELRRLTPKEYHADIDRLIARAKAAHERKSLEAEGFLFAEEATPSALRYDAGEDICPRQTRFLDSDA